MFSINLSKEVSRNKKRFRPEDGMKKSELSIDVESYLADMERLGRDRGRKKPVFTRSFGILHLFTSFCICNFFVVPILTLGSILYGHDVQCNIESCCI